MTETPGLIYSERNGHTLRLNEKSHRYFLKKKDEESFRPLVSTTTYSKFYPQSEQLIKWRIAQGLEEYIAGKKLDKAGDIGTWAHKLILQIEQGKTPDIPDIPELQNCIKLFRMWYEKIGKHDEILNQEAIMCDPDLMVAGTLDRLAKRNGKIVLTDYKTAKGIYGSYLFQMASYDQLLKTWFDIVPDVWEIARFGKEDDKPEVKTWSRTGDRELIQAYIEQTNRNLKSYRFNSVYSP